MHTEIWDTFVAIVNQFMRKALVFDHKVLFGK